MTRNQRARRRLRAEQRQAKRRQIKKQNNLAEAEQNEQIRDALANYYEGPWGENDFTWSVLLKEPKLAQDETAIAAIGAMKPLSRFRDVDEWQPTGKSTKALLQSLAEHLFAAWPMPKILWSVFWDEASAHLRRAVVKIAWGKSLYGLVKKGEFPIALTKKQCHQLTTMPARYSLMQAIRLMQIQAVGGNPVLFQQWWQTPIARVFQPPEEEIFWQQVLTWLARQTAINKKPLKGKQVIDLVAYFRHLRRQNGRYSVKGRSLENIMMDMKLWHKEQAVLQQSQGLNLPASGFIAARWQDTVPGKNGFTGNCVWEVKELRSKADLFAEGKAMEHCVYTYKGKIAKGHCSIWAVNCDGQKRVTVELLNHRKQIVQIQGRTNRDAKADELAAVQYWANLNGLQLCVR